MLNNLIIAAIIVVVLWVIILGIYLVLSRQQPNVQAQMRAIDEQLDKVERDARQR